MSICITYHFLTPTLKKDHFNVNIKEPNRGIIFSHSFIGAISLSILSNWFSNRSWPVAIDSSHVAQPPISFLPCKFWHSYLPALMFSLEKCIPQSLQSLPLLCFILLFLLLCFISKQGWKWLLFPEPCCSPFWIQGLSLLP